MKSTSHNQEVKDADGFLEFEIVSTPGAYNRGEVPSGSVMSMEEALSTQSNNSSSKFGGFFSRKNT